MVDLNFINNENTQGFLKRTALFGASAFMAPSLLGREGDGDCFFSQESASSMLVPMGDALKITGTFLDEISHDIPHQNWGEREWDQDFRYMQSIGIDTVIMIRSGYRKFITYPSAHLLGKGCYMPSVDLLDMFLWLAGKYHMKFYLVYMIRASTGIPVTFRGRLRITSM